MAIFIVYWLLGSIVCIVTFSIFVAYLINSDLQLRSGIEFIDNGINSTSLDYRIEQRLAMEQIKLEERLLKNELKIVKSEARSTHFVPIDSNYSKATNQLNVLYDVFNNNSSNSNLYESYNQVFIEFMNFYLDRYFDSRHDKKDFIVYIHHHYYKYFNTLYIAKYLGIINWNYGNSTNDIGAIGNEQIKMVFNIMPIYVFYITYKDNIIFKFHAPSSSD